MPKQKTPIEQAIEAIQAAQARGIPPPTEITLSEGAMAQVRDLVKNSPVAGTGRANTLLGVPINVTGQQITSVSWDEAAKMSKTQLEQQLEDSLWAMSTLHTPCFTRGALANHVGPGHMEGDWYVKHLYEDEVQLLCKCRMILVMARCQFDDGRGACEEPAFPKEGTFRKDVRCSQHE
jgi:hypothetical protein